MSLFYAGGSAGGSSGGYGGSAANGYNGGTVPLQAYVPSGGVGTSDPNDYNASFATLLTSYNVGAIDARIAKFNRSLGMGSISNKSEIRGWIAQLDARKATIASEAATAAAEKAAAEAYHALSVAQSAAYNTAYTNSVSANIDVLRDGIVASLSDYQNDRYGDVDDIALKASTVADIEHEIYKLEQADKLSAQYSTITNTSNTAAINSLKEDLAKALKELQKAKDVYDNAEFQRKLKDLQDSNDDDDWGSFNLVWLQGQGYGMLLGGYGYSSYTTPLNDTERQSHVNDAILGRKHLWMAGNYLYDSPRAGDLMFNETGDLNSVVHLGIKSRNDTQWSRLDDGRIGELNNNTFNNMAGDEYFSIKPQI